LAAAQAFAQAPAEWAAYGGDLGGTRYSPLEEINRQNVAGLKVAWTFRTGDLDRSAGFRAKAAFESTPLMVDGTLYLTTPSCQVFALDPATGEKRWSFDPQVNVETRFSEITNRGVAAWTDGKTRRIFLGTLDARLICLDAKTGAPCADFGKAGTVDLKDGITLKGSGQYQVTSPPAVIGDRVVVGSSMGDNRRADVEHGTVRCFDVRTGKQYWSWDPIPRKDSDAFADTWKGERARDTGAANVWSIISVDPERDLVFLPTTSPSPDHFGGERLGNNVFANSVVAIRASTGKVAWHFQVVHHDLWDYDLPCEPVLTEITVRGKRIPVVVQGTKIGHVFVLNRDTGEPVFPVEERPVPRSTVPGEQSSPTQPFPTVPAPLLDDLPRPFEVWSGVGDLDPATRAALSKLRYEGRFTPPSLEGTIQFPSTAGGMNWGGLSVDPVRGVLVANMNRFAHLVKLIPRAEFRVAGETLVGLRAETAIQAGTDYGMTRRTFVVNGKFATPPPWGVIMGVEIATGRKLWERPIGYENEAMKDYGSLMLGGNILTGGGLVFVAATRDGNFRALDIETGKTLWEDKLPVPAQSTPMTYRATAGGKQYVVICAGGHGKAGTAQGDYVVAYALP
jgi:quinoprotein glucose dehydrogenase